MNVLSLPRRRRAEGLHDFVTCAAELLASHDEPRRRHLESRLLAMLPDLQGTPVFDVFDIRDPALRAMLAEHGEETPRSASTPTRRAANGDNVASLAY